MIPIFDITAEWIFGVSSLERVVLQELSKNVTISLQVKSLITDLTLADLSRLAA
jgi:hypothetical protein